MSTNKKASPSTDGACSAMNKLDFKDEEEGEEEESFFAYYTYDEDEESTNTNMKPPEPDIHAGEIFENESEEDNSSSGEAILPTDWSAEQWQAHFDGEREAMRCTKSTGLSAGSASVSGSLGRQEEEAIAAALKASLAENDGGAAESSPISSMRTNLDSGKPWRCNICTLENKGMVLVCEVCLTIRPNS